ncbi:MAG: hypothetical protein BWY76_02845 [bacterium ADurb.Bin429]|nr:MAG: hypothetical protein BWY76_02845 [bacterium ADurb.Bin429]
MPARAAEWMRSTSSRKAGRLSSVSQICRGLARPSGTTAHASIHSIPDPPAANRSYLRKVNSVGRPSWSASHPSIGCTTMRFGTVSDPNRTGDASTSMRSVSGISTPNSTIFACNWSRVW